MLCHQVSGQRLGITKPSDRLALYGLSIAPAELLDNGSVRFTQRLTATDVVLDYYLHACGGAVNVFGGGFGEQEIQSLSISVSRRFNHFLFLALIKTISIAWCVGLTASLALISVKLIVY